MAHTLQRKPLMGTCKMLVLDTQAPIIAAIENYFGSFGFEVDACHELGQAIRRLEENRYSVIIVDPRLGATEQQEGMEFIRSVREQQPATLVIILTAYKTPTLTDFAEQMMLSLIEKPVPLPDLAQIVFGALDKKWLSKDES